MSRGDGARTGTAPQRCSPTVGGRLGGASPPHGSVWRVVHLVGHALGGRDGERLLHRLGMAVGDDTILRLPKRPAIEPLTRARLQVVGIDDWAWQKSVDSVRRVSITRSASLSIATLVGVHAITDFDAADACASRHDESPTVDSQRQRQS